MKGPETIESLAYKIQSEFIAQFSVLHNLNITLPILGVLRQKILFIHAQGQGRLLWDVTSGQKQPSHEKNLNTMVAYQGQLYKHEKHKITSNIAAK